MLHDYSYMNNGTVQWEPESSDYLKLAWYHLRSLVTSSIGACFVSTFAVGASSIGSSPF